MIKQVILGIFILIVLIDNINAIPNIDIDYPIEIQGYSILYINVSLIDFPIDIYDVKIEIFDSMDNTTKLSKTWNENSWQTSYKYVLDAINNSLTNSSEFKINITENSNITGNIMIRIRDTNNKIYSFFGYPILIISSDHIYNNSNIIENQTQNNTDENNEINISLSWDEDEIINGDEFSISIESSNLEDKKYDLKIYIYDDDKNKPISQTYDKDNGKWISSSYYITDLLTGPDSEDIDINLKIKEKYRDFSGNAKISVKLKESGKSKILIDNYWKIKIIENKSLEEDIEDEKKEDTKVNYKKENKQIEKYSENYISGEVIQLTNNKLKTENIKRNNYKIYESNESIIIKYSIYGFFILLISFIILIIFKKEYG